MYRDGNRPSSQKTALGDGALLVGLSLESLTAVLPSELVVTVTNFSKLG